MFTGLKIGHRGAPSHAPENTMASFKKAVELGVDAIELDIHLCKSGEAVVIHDDTLDRTTNGTGRVTEKTLSELKLLDAGEGEKIPTLDEVLKVITDKTIFIEIKAGWAAMKVAEIVAKHGYDRIVVISFNKNVLEAVKSIDKNINIGLNIEGKVSSIDSADYYSINPSIDVVTPGMVSLIHQNGMKVFAWTARDLKEVAKAKEAGVDGIMADSPKIL